MTHRLQPRSSTETCDVCRAWCVTSEKQLAVRLDNMRNIPSVTVHICGSCGGTALGDVAGDDRAAALVVGAAHTKDRDVTTQSTKDKLAAALIAADLHDMARRAAEGYYDDFLSPLDLPSIALDSDLHTAGTPAAMALRERHHNGEFDGTIEEGDAWAASADGQETLLRLIRKGKP